MADTSFATNAAAGGASFAADADGSGFEYPYVKLTFGASGTQTRVSTAAGLPVQQQSGASFTVVGAAADGAAASGNPVLIAGFDGTNAQSLSTTAGGLLQIHDGAGSITVDNGGTFAVQAAATEADGANVTLGAKADAKSTATDTTSITVMSVLKQVSASAQLSATAAKQPALGTAGVASADVISVQGIASGTAQPVSGTVAATQSGTWTVQPGNTANTTAWKVDASSVAVPITDNAGSLTVDAPVGTPAFVRLSDGAAAITTLAVSLASLPSGAVTNAGTFAVQATEADGANTTLGAKADAKSTATDTTAVTIMSVLKQISASAQAPPSQAVTNAGTFAVQAMPAVAASWALTNVNDSAASASLLASNASRKGATFYNDSTESLYLKFGTTASLTSFIVKILPGGYYELPVPIYTGAIDGIWSADASGAVRIGEAA